VVIPVLYALAKQWGLGRGGATRVDR